MAKSCSCHSDLHAAIEAGLGFWEFRRHVPAKSQYHEHKCECACGCRKDTSGYLKCAYCSWECQGEKRVPVSAKGRKMIAALLARKAAGEVLDL